MALQAAHAPGLAGPAALAVYAYSGAGTRVGGRASHMTCSASWLLLSPPACVRQRRAGAPRSRCGGSGPRPARVEFVAAAAHPLAHQSSLPTAIMLALISRLLDWFRSLFWKEEMELTLVGLQYSGKTTFVNVIAVSALANPPGAQKPASPPGSRPRACPGVPSARRSSR